MPFEAYPKYLINKYIYERKLNAYQTDMQMALVTMLASFGGKPPKISRFDEDWYQEKQKEPEVKQSLTEVLGGFAAHHEKLKTSN